ncbi:MAG: hypothetical protein ACXVRH_05630 [Thermoleophilaceae bacterium]
MRKERKGPLGPLAGLAEDLLAGAKRRQRDREPRVVLYDSAGHSVTLPEGEPRERMLELADELVSLNGTESE